MTDNKEPLTDEQQKLVESHLSLPRAYARRQKALRNLKPETAEELEGELILDLCQAARRFNPDHKKHAKFTTYAIRWMRGGVVDFFEKYHKKYSKEIKMNEVINLPSTPAKSPEHRDYLKFLEQEFKRANITIEKRQALLWYFSGRRMVDLAKLLKINETTLWSRRQIGMKEYKEFLKRL